LLLLGCVVAVYVIIYLDAVTAYNVKKTQVVGRADQQERLLTVNGFGKVVAPNDIAITTIGYSNVDKDVTTAYQINKKVRENIVADLKKLGIAAKDLQSDYSITPEYSYTDKGQELKGYRVTASVTVKIRDLTKISEVFDAGVKYGANQVSGLTFSIDDAENLKAEARLKALADARSKATILAKNLGERLVSVASYTEYDNTEYRPYNDMAKNVMAAPGAQVPGQESIPGGTKDVSMNVSITYEFAR
jgi:uncharacterized protein YggE